MVDPLKVGALPPSPVVAKPDYETGDGSLASYDLRVRTPGERLWLWRRRRPSARALRAVRGGSCMSQPEAAALLGLVPMLYWRVEQDRAIRPEVAEVLGAVRRIGGDLDIIPTRGELCALARRRSRRSLREVEREYGASRPIYMRAEAGGERDVVALWERWGFRFP